jgi:hypothetical protein
MLQGHFPYRADLSQQYSVANFAQQYRVANFATLRIVFTRQGSSVRVATLYNFAVTLNQAIW